MSTNSIVDMVRTKLKHWPLTPMSVGESTFESVHKIYPSPTYWDYLTITFGLSIESSPFEILFALLFENTFVMTKNTASMTRIIQILLKYVPMEEDERNLISEAVLTQDITLDDLPG